MDEGLPSLLSLLALSAPLQISHVDQMILLETQWERLECLRPMSQLRQPDGVLNNALVLVFSVFKHRVQC